MEMKKRDMKIQARIQQTAARLAASAAWFSAIISNKTQEKATNRWQRNASGQQRSRETRQTSKADYLVFFMLACMDRFMLNFSSPSKYRQSLWIVEVYLCNVTKIQRFWTRIDQFRFAMVFLYIKFVSHILDTVIPFMIAHFETVSFLETKLKDWHRSLKCRKRSVCVTVCRDQCLSLEKIEILTAVS
jgi:hypothetical protein